MGRTQGWPPVRPADLLDVASPVGPSRKYDRAMVSSYRSAMVASEIARASS
ncbi:hypothetical protein [Streptomyces sp. NPDC008001]|uniref:hypothetical protein n=1 Tax=Streptomyces sp. NPDC008001 TaxID=3364804 RepID=UPI0036E08D11